MSDQFAERAAEQIGQMSVTPGASAQDDIAQAALASTGLGVTEADIEAIKAQLASFQRQLTAQAQAQAKATPDDLNGSVASLRWYLLHNGDEVAQALGDDAAEAAKSATDGGNTGALSGIIKKIVARLETSPPAPGEQHYYRGALNTARHLPVVIDRVNAASSGGDQAPAKVVSGSVVG